MKYGIVALESTNFGIGKNGKLPWYYPEDFAFFKETTLNSICVMGKHTYQEIYDMRKDKPTLLPKRESLVLTTSDIQIHKKDTQVFKNYEELDDYVSKQEKDVFYIGGKTIFEDAMKNPEVNGFYVTFIKGKFDCDVFVDFSYFQDHFELSDIILENDNIQITKWLKL